MNHANELSIIRPAAVGGDLTDTDKKIDRDTLLRAILAGRKLSNADAILGSEATPEALSGRTEFLPPILIAGFQHAPLRSQDERKEEATEDLPETNAVLGFERLTLAMRAQAFPELLRDCEPDHTPPWLKADGRLRLTYCEGGDLATAIRAALYRLSNPVIRSATRSITRPGVKLVGMRIEGNLDLSRLELPFSVRLIGCWITGALILDRTHLHTLDLSGSVIAKGVSCNYLRSTGALRMRRFVATGPVDFGGAEIAATVDASDAIFIPRETPPNAISYVGDRGILNFSLARIGKDVRLNRHRSFGGVNLRGASIGGSLFMDDSLVRTPLGAIEAMASRLAVTNGKRTSPGDKPALEAGSSLPVHLAASLTADQDIAALLWPDRGMTAEQVSVLRAVEKLANLEVAPEPKPEAFWPSLTGRLLYESRHGATASIRAEGAEITGSLMAKGVRALGEIRLRSIKVGGRIALNGARIRAFASLHASIDTLKVEQAGTKLEERQNQVVCVLKKAVSHVLAHHEDQNELCALDLSLARVGGGVSLGRDDRGERPQHDTRELRRHIAKELCRLQENPIKFFPVFKRCEGDVNELKADYGKFHHAHARWKQSQEDSKAAKADRGNEAHPPDKPQPPDGPEGGLDLYLALRVVAEKVDARHYKYEAARRDHEDNATKWPKRPGRVDIPMDSDQVEEVADGCVKFGELSAALIIGQVNFDSADLGGDLNLSHAVFNIFDRTPASTTLSLRDAKIAGDLDFRNSVGARSIEAVQASVTGSILFADAPKYDPKTGFWQPITGRSFLPPAHDEASAPAARHAFERVTVSGNATFLFDAKTGPALDLAQATIGGRLAILPACGGLELNVDEIADDFAKAEDWRTRGRIHPNRWLKASGQLVFGKPARQEELQDGLRDLRKAPRRPPEIDLRSARATLLAHPPSAWPQQDGLVIEGFKYEQSREYGPLPPFRRGWPEVEQDVAANAHVYLPITVAVAGLALLLVLFGWVTFDLLSRARLVTTYVVASALVLTLLGGRMFGSNTLPRREQAAPLALNWLKLQRRRFNTRRVYRSIHPFEPYIHAARVLRASGRVNVANEVELARLRQRCADLSWRNSPLTKTGLRATDFLMHYGFAPMRAVAISLGILIGSAVIAAAADNQGQVLASNAPRLLLDTRAGAVTTRATSLEITPTTALGTADGAGEREATCLAETLATRRSPACSPVSYPDWDPFLFSLDQMIPVLDLGVSQNWSIASAPTRPVEGWTPPAPPKVETGASAAPPGDDTEAPAETTVWARSLAPWLALYLAVLLPIIGWILTILTSVAIVSRIETIIARNEET